MSSNQMQDKLQICESHKILNFVVAIIQDYLRCKKLSKLLCGF